jgi:hypothetical protein
MFSTSAPQTGNLNPYSSTNAARAEPAAATNDRHALPRAQEGAWPNRASIARNDASYMPGPCRQGRVKLIAAAHGDHVGDTRQANAVATQTARLLEQKRGYAADAVSTETFSIKGNDHAAKVRQLRDTVQYWQDRLADGTYQHVVFVLSGSDQALASVLGDMPRHPRMTTVFTGHQLTQDIKDAQGLPDITALPKSASMTADERTALDCKTKLLRVTGVAHDLTEEKIAATVAEYREKGHPAIPPITRDTVAVILGGDAPDEHNHIRRFTEDDALALARHIATLELTDRERCRILVTNGPRTGKHGPDGKERVPNPHRTEQLDPVTRKFVDTLLDHTGIEVFVFDFQFAKTPSAYVSILQAFREVGGQSGRVHVPGESVQMINEAAALLPRGILAIDETPAMSAPHHREVRTMADEHGIPVLDSEGNLRRKSDTSADTAARPIIPAAQEIAEAIVARIPAPSDAQTQP